MKINTAAVKRKVMKRKMKVRTKIMKKNLVMKKIKRAVREIMRTKKH